MALSVKQMLEAANAVVPKITPEKAKELIAKGDALVVDVRDAPELVQTGKVKGAVHVSRCMLEFRADPDSPYYDKNFSKDKNVIVYCASGGRAQAIAEKLEGLGYKTANMGGYEAWRKAGLPVRKSP